MGVGGEERIESGMIPENSLREHSDNQHQSPAPVMKAQPGFPSRGRVWCGSAVRPESEFEPGLSPSPFSLPQLCHFVILLNLTMPGVPSP